uniref:EOG090X0EYT n=1 Tax=Scapholeberis mucronata TaxID=202097 RepID=A0A4Y7NKZ7_9CRUS|nr:EOG090X0EYT [Scapholeberis mucronata]
MSSSPSAATGGAGVGPAAPPIAPAYPSPHLKKVLRSYQSTASSSLSGPNGILTGPEHADASLAYYVYPNLPLPVVAAKTVVNESSSNSGRLRVKSEPIDDVDADVGKNKAMPVNGQPTSWPITTRGPEYDEFKVLKLKRPAYYATVTTTSSKDKDAVDLSSNRDAATVQTATKPASSPSPFAALLVPVPAPSAAAAAPPPPHHQQQQQQQQQPATQPSPQPSFPILSVADRGWSHAERNETLLEGQPIACFTVGGEPRLCLPQILNSVLRQFFVMQIHAVCDELQINCSRCTAEQLDSLKASPAILPRSAASCGLITKTDAQRLCSALLRRGGAENTMSTTNAGSTTGETTKTASAIKTEPEPVAEEEMDMSSKSDGSSDHSDNSFRVYHQCFGKCEGVCKPELYTSPDAACIECADCSLTLSPADFISHAHRSLENRTCHWGFDSAHWRAYLLLARRQHHRQSWNEKLLRQLDEFKNRFFGSNASHATAVPAPPPPHTALHATAPVTVKRKLQIDETTRPAGKALHSPIELMENHHHPLPHSKRYKEQDGRQSPAGALATPYDPAYHVYGYVLHQGNGLRESPPPLQETSTRIPHDKAGQPNVTLLAPPRLRLSPHPAALYAHANPSLTVCNPEIELSSTDTEDSESIPSHNGGLSCFCCRMPIFLTIDSNGILRLACTLLDEKQGSNWDLPSNLANEVNSVEELLKRGGCDSTNSRLVLQVAIGVCGRHLLISS